MQVELSHSSALDVATKHRRAVMKNKALVLPSSCIEHPKYQAKRYPTSGCQECLAIFAEVQRSVA
jgi:hypothetical protein